MIRKLPLILAFLLLGSLPSLYAQVTTASIFGKVTDDKGEALVGATVTATHEASGTFYGTTTRNDGRYTLPNLRIGGPYTVDASYVGYENGKESNIYLSLGQKKQINMSLKEGATSLDEVVVTALQGGVINKDRTGASVTISSQQLKILPTISRSTADFYRLTPMAAGNSIAGRNDQFNNFTLDGSIFNNPFGLDAATPGGQTGAQPIPLDAIEQIQVSISPFDVTQAGFTGAAINAVTKSGTNEFTGTVYGFFRNQDLTGRKVGDIDLVVPDLSQLQTGVSFGGPLIKNKLFFFATFELERREDLGSNFLAARPGLDAENVSRVQASDFDAVSSALNQRFGYVTGPYEGYIHATDNQKGIIKFDYNINQNHSITAKYNFLDATRDKPAHPSAIGRRGPDQTTLQFENSGYQISNKIHSGIVEWKALFSNKIANKLSVGYTVFTDDRSPFSTPFPVINIAKNGSRYIVAGHEPFSIHNRLDQNVLQITNDLNIYAGAHTFTVGAALEKFDFNNSFNLDAYGGTFIPDFVSTQAFLDSLGAGVLDGQVIAAQETFDRNGGDNGTEGEGWALAETNVGQAAVYGQWEWAASEKLTTTLGLRVDIPLYFDTKEKIQENIDRNCCYFDFIEYYDDDGNLVTFDHTQLPDQKPLFSPRFGFNYDVLGDESIQLRGGTGLFTGRFPFVWVGNHVANPNFFFYNYTDTDFKFPQIWKTNLGYDQKFGKGWVATIDLLYGKDINAMTVRNRGLNQPTGIVPGVDNRPFYQVSDQNPFGNNAYVFTNTDKGYTFNATFQLERNWGNNFFTSLGYNFGISKDVSSIEAEISSDAYDRNPTMGNVNEDVLSNSIYGNRHRVVGTASKRFVYGEGKFATSFALFFEYTEGNRYSYTYSGNINLDGAPGFLGSPLNDLIYIPTNSEIDMMTFSGDMSDPDPANHITAEQMANGLKAYIAQDEYLSGRRGDYAEKYSSLAPWFSTWDIRILQDFNFKVGERTNTFQLSFDILNVGNLISGGNWGVRKFPTTTQPIGVTFDGVNEPVYSFDPSLTKTFTDDFSLLSRWQLQIGGRYIF